MHRIVKVKGRSHERMRALVYDGGIVVVVEPLLRVRSLPQ